MKVERVKSLCTFPIQLVQAAGYLEEGSAAGNGCGELRGHLSLNCVVDTLHIGDTLPSNTLHTGTHFSDNSDNNAAILLSGSIPTATHKNKAQS